MQAEVKRLKSELSIKEEESRCLKQKAEKDRNDAQRESSSNQSEIRRLKKEVQSLIERQRQIETQKKVTNY